MRIVYLVPNLGDAAAKRRFSKSVEVDAAPDESTVLLREIRDALTRPGTDALRP